MPRSKYIGKNRFVLPWIKKNILHVLIKMRSQLAYLMRSTDHNKQRTFYKQTKLVPLSEKSKKIKT